MTFLNLFAASVLMGSIVAIGHSAIVPGAEFKAVHGNTRILRSGPNLYLPSFLLKKSYDCFIDSLLKAGWRDGGFADNKSFYFDLTSMVNKNTSLIVSISAIKGQ